MSKARVFLIDDHRILREGINALLSENEYYEVVGEASNAREALEKLQDVKPDVILLDIAMPELSGLNAISQIKKVSPAAKIIILSMYDKSSYICSALSQGVLGYLLKDVTAKELYGAIDAVLSGKLYLGERINQLVIREYVDMTHEGKFVSPLDTLTGREREVMQLVVEGRTGKEIAGRLHISYKTVEHHRYSIMRKLDCKNVAQLIRLASSEGMTPE